MENSYYHILVDGKPSVWVGYVTPLTDKQVVDLAVECHELDLEQAKIAQVQEIDEETWKARK
jgi:hypothetical protein